MTAKKGGNLQFLAYNPLLSLRIVGIRPGNLLRIVMAASPTTGPVRPKEEVLPLRILEATLEFEELHPFAMP